jgi:hypothetical protein
MLACEKEDESNDAIIGKWEWIMTSYGDYNYPRTPKTVDSTYFIEFGSDQNYYLLGSSNNQISKVSYILGNTAQIKTIKFEDSDSTGLIYGYNINRDTLSLWKLNQFYPSTNIYKRVFDAPL